MFAKTKVFSFFLTAILLTVPFVSHAAPYVSAKPNIEVSGVLVKTNDSYQLQVIDQTRPECSATAELGVEPVCMTLTLDLLIGGIPLEKVARIMNLLSNSVGQIVTLSGGYNQFWNFLIYEVKVP